MSAYNVVFRYTQGAGSYAGVITWTAFTSKADFDSWLEKTVLEHQEVIAQGVSQEEAIALSCSTPLISLINVAIAESTNPDTGVTNNELLRLKMMSVMLTM
jgi:hypothetical protein